MTSRSISRLSFLVGRVLLTPETPKPACRRSSGFRKLSTSNLEEHISESRTKEDESTHFIFKEVEETPMQSTPRKNGPSFGDWTNTGQYIPQGIHKAILLGEVRNPPIQKTLRSGRTITVFSVGTGGRRSFWQPACRPTEMELQRQDTIQWHRVVVYQDRLAAFAVNLKPGAQVYVEGNIETRSFNDPLTNVVKHVREVAIRQNGRVMHVKHLGNSSSGN